MQRAKALSLYRSLRRKANLLPREAQGYYKNFVKTNFIAHGDESDPEVLDRIFSLAVEQAEWVLKKYGVAQVAK